MFLHWILLLVFSGISVSQAQIELPKDILDLINAILKDTTDIDCQNSLVNTLRSIRYNDNFEQIIWEVTYLLDPMEDEDIHYYMYVGDISNVNIFSDSNVTDITKPDKTAKYVFLFHGWMGSKDFMPKAGITILINKGYIVIIADYPFAVKDPKYISPALRSIIIGNKIGKALKTLGIPENQMTFIGHSLGGHIAAATSDYLSHKCNNTEDPSNCIVDKIYGLDAAGPILAIYITPLSKESANYVAAFHTSIFGAITPMGLVDYYAADITGACAKNFGKDAHNAIVDYFVKGMSDCNLYKAFKCSWLFSRDIFKDFPTILTLSLTYSNPQSAYMNFNAPTSVEGIYCLNLNKNSPECSKDY